MRWTAPLALGIALLGSPVAAQDRTPGWIGISFEVATNRRGRVTEVLITEVNRGSPAEAAGLQIGDRLLAVNDLNGPDELRNLVQRLELRAGDRVRMLIERDGRHHEIRLRAAERPRAFVASQRLELSFEPDSMVETIVRAMDSLRIQLVEGRGQNLRVVREPSSAGGRITVVTSSGRRTVQAPFEFFVFRGEEHDSLRREMDDLNRAMADLEVRLAARAGELQRTLGAVSQVRLAQDAEFGLMQVAMEAASRRSVALESAMADAARTTAGFQYSLVAPRNAAEPTRVRPRTEAYRPLTPYVVGRNRVAGAEVIDLRPELAEYFRTEGGVLVVDVAQGTPAAISGIVPGDVITRLDQVAVRSVEDFRFGVSRAGETLPITLIRQGTSIQVLLRL